MVSVPALGGTETEVVTIGGTGSRRPRGTGSEGPEEGGSVPPVPPLLKGGGGGI